VDHITVKFSNCHLKSFLNQSSHHFNRHQRKALKVILAIICSTTVFISWSQSMKLSIQTRLYMKVLFSYLRELQLLSWQPKFEGVSIEENAFPTYNRLSSNGFSSWVKTWQIVLELRCLRFRTKFSTHLYIQQF